MPSAAFLLPTPLLARPARFVTRRTQNPALRPRPPASHRSAPAACIDAASSAPYSANREADAGRAAPAPPPGSTVNADGADLADAAVALVAVWLGEAAARATPAQRATRARLAGLACDRDSAAFTMQFVDRVARARSDEVAARQLAAVVGGSGAPQFLGAVDRLLLMVGGWAAGVRGLAGIVVPLARWRMRWLVGGLVVPAEDGFLEHVEQRKREGFALNVNLLGELVLGDEEAEKRLDAALKLLRNENVEYVSVKVSAVTAQLHRWDFSGSLSRIEMNLIRVFTQAAAASPRTFVNLDMESYDDLELTIEAFTSVLGRDEFAGLDAGIVIQAYLPDALPTMQRLVAWSNERFKRAGGQIKIRLVKGANLAMERVEAEMRGWTQAPYASKAETDANWIRCLDWMLERPVRTLSVRLGVASHNLFDVAYARLVSIRRGLQDRVQFEMLQGMIQAEADVVRRTNEDGRLLLYTPIVEEKNFDTAVAYLFRRLEENSSGDNFLRSLFTMHPGSVTFQAEAAKFRASLASGSRRDLWNGPRRFQQRPAVQAVASSELQFVNEPDTDPSQPQNRLWAASQLDATTFVPVSSPVLTTVEEVDAVLARSAAAVGVWRDSTVESRRSALRRIGDELARRRGDLINAMVIEGGKVLEEADAEVSEAIDFAFYYAEQACALPKAFKSFGTAVVVSPWNYPVAIACGGVFASLAAGNAVVLKPAPETPRCAEIAAECVDSAGLPDSVFQFVRVPENDVGRRLICGGDCVILTGAYETAKLFQSWNPTMRLFAETSGKNCMVITPNADLDLAASDLVSSAFGHAGQKCSATSLCILVGNVGDDDRFLRQVMDATESIAVGPATNIATTMGPLISAPNERLERALTHLDEGESWLVKPTCMDEDGEKRLWTPGVKMNAGKWFQSTECFGPVLGIVVVKTLEDAIRLQNAGMFGLTAGLQSLDPFEIETWSNAVQAGNLYINRGTTGAIVRRQPFGGWKRSSFGSGAMAGGRNYVRQLGRSGDSSELNTLSNGEWLARATDSDLAAVRCLFEVDTDDAGLTCEANLHRYRLARVCVRVSPNARALDVERVRAAFQNCGNVPVDWSDCTKETAAGYAARLGRLNVDRVRIVGAAETEVLEAATLADVYAADSPVVLDGNIELLNYLREQCVTRTMHRFGNVLAE